MTQPFTYSAREDFYCDCSAHWETAANDHRNERGCESYGSILKQMNEAVGDLFESILTEKRTGPPAYSLSELAALCYLMAEQLECEDEDDERL